MVMLPDNAPRFTPPPFQHGRVFILGVPYLPEATIQAHVQAHTQSVQVQADVTANRNVRAAIARMSLTILWGSLAIIALGAALAGACAVAVNVYRAIAT